MMELRQIQITQIELLKEVDKICKLNNINYFIVDGSALGAYYLNKMLPWDDDIDIGMYIDDYNRFLDYCLTSDNYQFLMKDCLIDNEFGCSFGQFIDRTIAVHQRCNEKSSDIKGIFIDIHPFVDDSSVFIIRFINYLIFKFFKHILLYLRNYGIYSGVKKHFLRLVTNYVSEKDVLEYIKKRRCKKYNTNIAVKIHGRHFNDYIKKSNLKNMGMIIFEGMSVPIMPDAKRMLDSIYGEFDVDRNECNRHEFIFDKSE